MIVISIREQTLYHRRSNGVRYGYRISTAARGAGNREGSLQTPLGRHRICAKIGGGYPLGTIFKGRHPVGIYEMKAQAVYALPRIGEKSGRAIRRSTRRLAALHGDDWILSRILWLTGTKPGINRRGDVDTRSRYIYIHGTHDEENLGRPVSHGCIRMGNLDVMELFAHVRPGERVTIRE